MSFAPRAARVSMRLMRSIPARGSTRAVLKRNMASHGPEQNKSSDTPWIVSGLNKTSLRSFLTDRGWLQVGSAVVFVPTVSEIFRQYLTFTNTFMGCSQIIYLLRPSKDKKGHGGGEHHHAPAKVDSKVSNRVYIRFKTTKRSFWLWLLACWTYSRWWWHRSIRRRCVWGNAAGFRVSISILWP